MQQHGAVQPTSIAIIPMPRPKTPICSGERRLPACSSRQPVANRSRAHIRLAKRGHSAQRPNAAGWQPALPRNCHSYS